MTQHDHYRKNVSHLKTIDVYRVLQLFNVTDQAVGHAVKKLLCAGQRGAKDYERDLREAVDSINRALQMIAEDCNKAPVQRGMAGDTEMLTAIAWTALGAVAYGLCRFAVFFVTDAFEDAEE